MRRAYKAFVEKNFPNSQMLKYNERLLKEELYTEARYLFSNKLFKQSFNYFKQAIAH